MDFFIWKPAESKKVVSELHAFHVTLGSVKGHFHTQKKFIALVERPKTKFLRKELKYKARYHFAVPLVEEEKAKNLKTSLVTLESLSNIGYFPTLDQLHLV